MKETFGGSGFLFFRDKDVEKVSGAWKALHISIFVALATVSFITSMAAGNMFQTFKYNCILFCTNITFEKELISAESFQQTVTLPKDESSLLSPNNILETENNDTLFRKDNFTAESELYSNDTITLDDSDSNLQNKTVVTKKKNETILFRNQTHIFQQEDDFVAVIHAKIDLRKTAFSSNFWCHFVLGIALGTFIFATFFAVLLAMCSKGGKGRNNTLNRPQNMVYPILVTSIFFGILNFVASIFVKKGMDQFCSSFQKFTNETSCSTLINKFTIHERQENFYFPYTVLSHTFHISVILFACQVTVTLLRVIYAVDYQLYALEVDNEEEENDLEVEDGRVITKERSF